MVHSADKITFIRTKIMGTIYNNPVSELRINEFEPRLKFAKNRFQLNAGLNLETVTTILFETNDI